MSSHAESSAAPTHPNIDESSKTQQLQKNACLVCRRRKLRCDGVSPSCGRCARLGHECIYNDARKKSGPRRGYVKGLESRLAQVEDLLKKYETSEGGKHESSNTLHVDIGDPSVFDDLDIQMPLDLDQSLMTSAEDNETFSRSFDPLITTPFSGINLSDLSSAPLDDASLWAMIELGVEEPLPPQDTIDELTEIYFTKVHPSIPIIHQSRYLASLSLPTHSRPPISLRYAILSHSASITPSYHHLHIHFHLLSRKYAQIAETSPNRQKYINIQHVQAWLLIAMYEFKMMMFPNAWMTTGRAVRICQMLGLHRLDGLGLDVKRTLRGVGERGEREERRRAFWWGFSMDRYAAVGTGWPLIVDERDIVTNMPCSEEAFEQGMDDAPGISLAEAMSPAHASSLSPFAGCVVVASLTGRVFQHLHRPTTTVSEEEENLEFWKRHRSIDNTLLNMSLYLPAHLRLPSGSSNPNTIFLNMSLQSAVICLHQAAIFKAEKQMAGTAELVVEESKARCFAAAMQVSHVMKWVAHVDLATLNVYTPFSLYVATRIFAEIAKRNPYDDEAQSSMRFLLSALVAIKDSNPLAESYLLQLDLEGFGLPALQENVTFSNLEQSVV
ncbi:uncharacterized protein LY89DRAFT_592586 [Mollisia scopiformis]|uniref:Zn(2)-C6 fungal-type domain-containing protein n=1 Tax=Mollisia scopiformis TaxID=149040 RepID=A0A194WXY9_MOLSC|nr:uncharacterized protein LY89DRAFT_592586 [Mollisia scopiformis]KUJ12841.1 hypothetical protein LY89DRAFT_592586 [Mollisia scopiformis]